MKSVDDYIEDCDAAVQPLLRRIRSIILEAAPQAAESIAYAMPAYKLYGRPLIYFAAFARHIGIYATPLGQQELAAELAAYKQGKGSIQLPLDKPMPYDLIARIVDVRIRQVTAMHEQRHTTKQGRHS